MAVKDCQHPACVGFAKYTVSSLEGKTPVDACGRHLGWAVEFIGSPDTAVRVYLIPGSTRR